MILVLVGGDDDDVDVSDWVVRDSARRTATNTASRMMLSTVSSSSQMMMPRITSERSRPRPQPHSSTTDDAPVKTLGHVIFR